MLNVSMAELPEPQWVQLRPNKSLQVMFGPPPTFAVAKAVGASNAPDLRRELKEGENVLTDVGEYMVGAYLQLIEGCDVIDYNVRPPGGGMDGLGELDVIGLNFKTNTAFLCEVTTHIRGLLYKTNKETVTRILKKHDRQKDYAKKYLSNFDNLRFQFWSPVVPVGYVTGHLEQIESLELIINTRYKECVEHLLRMAADTTHDARNPVFRVMQILGHLRG